MARPPHAKSFEGHVRVDPALSPKMRHLRPSAQNLPLCNCTPAVEKSEIGEATQEGL